MAELIAIRFQFQNGTIKRCKCLVSSITRFSFQFQNGTIKRTVTKNVNDIKLGFQFQNGTIKRFSNGWSLASYYNISIPKWYD